tara:strand:- start:2964 stop:3767 length:804 start_codon:yes stop_codon:yes gene_type:complete
LLSPRIIPCLLIRDKGLIKTLNFGNDKYVGDPLNAVKIFNEKSVDELIVLDIDATANQMEPNYELIRHLAIECRMPLCYGGGIKTKEQAIKILGMGVEKIAISSAAISNPMIINDIAKKVGRQSIVIVLDVKRNKFRNKYSMYTHNGKNKTDLDPIKFAMKVERIGCGEILINSIDHDGKMKGYDNKIIHQIRNKTTVPLTILGGAGSMDDIGRMIEDYGIIGLAAGSLFVFKGKYKAVLINYPDTNEKEKFIIKKLNSYETNYSIN